MSDTQGVSDKGGWTVDEAERLRSLSKAVLFDLMSDISEDCWCAGWLHGNEFALWNAVINGPQPYGMGEIDAEQIARLKQLSEDAGGWWVWGDDASDGESFLAMSAWLEKFEARAALRLCQSGEG